MASNRTIIELLIVISAKLIMVKHAVVIRWNTSRRYFEFAGV